MTLTGLVMSGGLIAASAMSGGATALPALTQNDVLFRAGHGLALDGRLYPKAALARGASGSVVVRCTVTGAHTLAGCQVDSEAPMGLGFARAAMRATSEVVVEGAAKDGAGTVGRTLRLRINFRPDGSVGTEL